MRRREVSPPWRVIATYSVSQRRLAVDVGALLVGADDRDDAKRARIDFQGAVDVGGNHFPSPATIGIAHA